MIDHTGSLAVADGHVFEITDQVQQEDGTVVYSGRPGLDAEGFTAVRPIILRRSMDFYAERAAQVVGLRGMIRQMAMTRPGLTEEDVLRMVDPQETVIQGNQTWGKSEWVTTGV